MGLMFSSVPPLQGSDLLLNPTQGFTLGYSLSPLQGSGDRPCFKGCPSILGVLFRALEVGLIIYGLMGFGGGSSPHFSHLLVTKRRKGRPECVAPRATEAPANVLYSTLRRPGAPACGSHSQDGSLRRCSRAGVRNAG